MGGQSPAPARPRDPGRPAGPPCPCARGFGCGSTGRCCKHTCAPPPRPPGCSPPGQGGGVAGGSAGRPCPASPASSALLPEGLAAGQLRGGRDSGRAAASGGSVPGSGPATFLPGFSGSPSSAGSPGFFVLFVWEKHPRRRPVSYGNPDASRFPSRAQKSQASITSGRFPSGQFGDAE